MAHKGIKELNKYRSGGVLTRAQAMAAMCAECMGDYIDGRMDCKTPECPLYPWMAYRKIDSKAVAHRKPMTNEHKEKMRQGRDRLKVESYA